MKPCRPADRCVGAVHGGDVHVVIESGVTHQSGIPSRMPCRRDEAVGQLGCWRYRLSVGSVPRRILGGLWTSPAAAPRAHLRVSADYNAKPGRVCGLADAPWARTGSPSITFGLTCLLFPPLVTQAGEFGLIWPIMKWWQALMSQFGFPLLGDGKSIPGNHT